MLNYRLVCYKSNYGTEKPINKNRKRSSKESQPLAPIMIVSADLRAAFDDRPEKSHLMAGYFELRPRVFYELYVSVDLWRRYVQTLPPEKD